MKLVLTGLRGTGKSTVGRILAERLRWDFFDTDALVEERAGATIRQLFEKYGEPHFRKLECEIVREYAPRDKAVVATGGGAILDSGNIAALKNKGFVVHLTATPAELWRRISRDPLTCSSRPKLLQEADSGIDELKKLMLARAAAYARARDVEVWVEDRSPDEIAEATLLLLKAHQVKLDA
jgi:shikimate kinase